MKQFIKSLSERLKKDTEKFKFVLGATDLEQLRRIICLHKTAFDELKEHVLNEGFSDNNEEILFFKEWKPRLVSKFLLYQKFYNMEVNNPFNERYRKTFLQKELKKIEMCRKENQALYQYWKSKETDFDQKYFLRPSEVSTFSTVSFSIEHETRFSTGYDSHIAKFMFNETLKESLHTEIKRISKTPHSSAPNFLWTADDNELVLLMYALNLTGCLNNGKLNLNEVIPQMAQSFGIRISDSNLARAFSRAYSKKRDFFKRLEKAIQTHLINLKKLKQKPDENKKE